MSYPPNPRLQRKNGPVDLSTNKVWPLGIKGLRDVLSNISSYYTNCKNDVKFIIAAMATEMKQLVFEGVKNIREISIEAQTSSQECVMSITKDIIIVPAFCQSHVSYDTRPDRSYQKSSATKRHRVRANRYRLTLTI